MSVISPKISSNQISLTLKKFKLPDIFWTIHDPNYKSLIDYLEEIIYEERNKNGIDKNGILKSEEFEDSFF